MWMTKVQRWQLSKKSRAKLKLTANALIVLEAAIHLLTTQRPPYNGCHHHIENMTSKCEGERATSEQRLSMLRIKRLCVVDLPNRKGGVLSNIWDFQQQQKNAHCFMCWMFYSCYVTCAIAVNHIYIYTICMLMV